jgi:O-antigen ligase
MVIACLFLITLTIAPQLWVDPIKNWPVDWIVYPAWLIYLLINRKLLAEPLNIQDKIFLFFVCWIPVSLIVNGELFVEQTDLGIIFIYYIKLFVLYCFISRTFTTFESTKSFLMAFVAVSILLSVEGIQHKYHGIGWADQTLGWITTEAKEAGVAGRTRWVGIFNGPGVFCVIYTIALPFLIMNLNSSIRKSIRAFSLLSIAIVLVAIYFTGSRGGIVTSVCIIGASAFLMIKNKKILLILGGIGALGLAAITPAYLTRIDDPEKSTYHRIEMWSEGIEMIKQNPVFGIGRGNFGRYTQKLIAHSSPIEIMGETGLPGFLAWIGLIYFSFKSLILWMRGAAEKHDKLLSQALGISIGGYILSSLFVTLEYETFYMLLGLARTSANGKISAGLLQKKDFKNIGLIAIVWIIIVYIGVNIYKIIFF